MARFLSMPFGSVLHLVADLNRIVEYSWDNAAVHNYSPTNYLFSWTICREIYRVNYLIKILIKWIPIYNNQVNSNLIHANWNLQFLSIWTIHLCMHVLIFLANISLLSSSIKSLYKFTHWIIVFVEYVWSLIGLVWSLVLFLLDLTETWTRLAVLARHR